MEKLYSGPRSPAIVIREEKETEKQAVKPEEEEKESQKQAVEPAEEKKEP